VSIFDKIKNTALLDLIKAPRLAGLLACQVKGFRPFDHIVLKELRFHEGEVVGRVGVML